MRTHGEIPGSQRKCKEGMTFDLAMVDGREANKPWSQTGYDSKTGGKSGKARQPIDGNLGPATWSLTQIRWNEAGAYSIFNKIKDAHKKTHNA